MSLGGLLGGARLSSSGLLSGGRLGPGRLLGRRGLGLALHSLLLLPRLQSLRSLRLSPFARGGGLSLPLRRLRLAGASLLSLTPRGVSLLLLLQSLRARRLSGFAAGLRTRDRAVLRRLRLDCLSLVGGGLSHGFGLGRLLLVGLSLGGRL